jgi:hypothetical protein
MAATAAAAAALLTDNVSAVNMPRLCHRGEVDARGGVLVLGVDPNILHMANQVSLLILAAQVAPAGMQAAAVHICFVSCQSAVSA